MPIVLRGAFALALPLLVCLLPACGPQELSFHTEECAPGHGEAHSEWDAAIEVPALWETEPQAPGANLLKAWREGYAAFLGKPTGHWPVAPAALPVGAVEFEARLASLLVPASAWEEAEGPWRLGNAIGGALERAAASTGQREALEEAVRASLYSGNPAAEGIAQLVSRARTTQRDVNSVSLSWTLLRHTPSGPLRAALCRELSSALVLTESHLYGAGRPCPAGGAR